LKLSPIFVFYTTKSQMFHNNRSDNKKSSMVERLEILWDGKVAKDEGEKLNRKFCGMNYDILDKIDFEPNKIA